MDPKEESAVSELFKAARIPWSQLDGRTQRNEKGNVVKLRFSPCLELEEIPNKIKDLSWLEEIYLFWASRRLTRLPSDSFDRLQNLRVLQLRWCQGIKELPKLSGSIEELVIEACDDDIDLSSFRAAKRTWKRLRSLHIIQVGRRGVTSLVDAFSTGDDCHGQDDNTIHHMKSKQDSSRTLESYFPSLACLSLRHDSIHEVDLAKLWPFFRRCPRLTNIDLGNNRISSLEELAYEAMIQTDIGSGIQEVPRMALRELNLTGNPCCIFSHNTSGDNFDDSHIDEIDRERDVDVDADADNDTYSESQQNSIRSALARTGTTKIQRSIGQDEHLLRIIAANPQLVSLLVCSGKCRMSNNNNSNNNESGGGLHHSYCTCFQKSALYSPSVRHALDLNRCCRGKTLMGTTTIISYHEGYKIVPTSLSLPIWSFVLERVNRIFDHRLVHSGDTYSSCLNKNSEECQECPGKDLYVDEINSIERQASVIYCLLQGPVFAARGSIPSSDEILRALTDER